jgi:hypothetical protein
MERSTFSIGLLIWVNGVAMTVIKKGIDLICKEFVKVNDQ